MNLFDLPPAFYKNVMPVTESGCWLWTAGCGSSGYGLYWNKLEQKNVLAHRFSYAHFKGPIPSERYPDHLCMVKCCVNPTHLEAVTCSENIKRSWRARAKTHCKWGHLLSGPNLVINGRGHRVCCTCRREGYHRRTNKLDKQCRVW